MGSTLVKKTSLPFPIINKDATNKHSFITNLTDEKSFSDTCTAVLSWMDKIYKEINASIKLSA